MATKPKARTGTIKEPVITLSAGPVATYPAIQRAFATPVQYDFDPWFQNFYEQVARKAANALRVLEDGLIMKSEANLIVSRTAAWTPLKKAQLEALISVMGGVQPGISTQL